jgi:hypothetical protein
MSDGKVENCIGAFTDKPANVKYELSLRNAIVGVIFVETIIVPVVVVYKETLCPVRH